VSDNREHSLEVVLPFLQHYLGDFELVPIVLGRCDSRTMAGALEPYLGPDTLLVVSSDLSHYLPYDQAVARDRQTIDFIMGLEVEALGRRENCACGKAPLQVLMTLARRLRWEPVLLHYANSGDTAGDRARVVGYAALAFFGDADGSSADAARSNLSPAQGALLVRLARQTIANALRNNRPEDFRAMELLDQPGFDQRCGNFVTLEQHGRLRGCIGNLVSDEPLRASVPRNALRAAFHDPRFAPLKIDELDALTISVSVLTLPAPFDYRDADDLLERLQPHRDGVILQRGHDRATFLPHVWDQIPDPETFLSALCRKAGWRPDTWRREKLVVHTYRAHYFNEKP
ncbi:MAG: AmmeMemoRadiSam system protein A, partial [Desulfosarcina sp.]|nr:AmmeMemoRadiSam system protein A [Desulfobacterales bacterium]